MKLFLDIETVPDQSKGAIDRFMGADVKCPLKTKGDIGKDLGMPESEYKFIGAEDLKQLWIEKKGKEAATAQAEEKWLKTSFDGAYGQIVCIAFAVNDGEIAVVTDEGRTEKEMLEDFWSLASFGNEMRTPTMIAHNAKFDLPFLYHRSVINGVEPSFIFDPHSRQGSKRYCTMEAWAGFNGMIGLDRLCEILGIKGKQDGMSGADVWPEYEKGNVAKIAEYCKEDVRALIDVYNKLNFK